MHSSSFSLTGSHLCPVCGAFMTTGASFSVTFPSGKRDTVMKFHCTDCRVETTGTVEKSAPANERGAAADRSEAA